MSIQFEQNTKRKSERFHFPAEVLILQERLPVTDWSFEGFACETANKKQANLLKQFSGKIELVLLTDDDEEVKVPLSACTKWQQDTMAGFEFTAMDNTSKQILGSYFRACLEGDFATFSELSKKLRPYAFPVQPNKTLTHTEKAELNTKFIRNFILYGMLLLLLAGGGVTYFYLSRFIVVSHKAILAADLMDVPVKLSGVVDHVYVQEGQTVQPGAPLYSLSKDAVESEIAQTEQEINKQAALINLSAVQFAEAQRAQHLYMQSADKDQNVLRARKAALEEATRQMALEKDLYEHAEKVGGVSKLAVDQKKAALQQSMANLDEVKSELSFSGKNVSSANNGLYYTPSGIKGNLAELQANITVQRKALDELKSRLQMLKSTQNEYVVRATTAGYVTNIAPILNQYAQAGTRIMTLLPQQNPMYVIAAFPNTIESDLVPGDRVEVYSPIEKQPVTGTVEHIYIESAPTLVKPDLNEVAVKIDIDQPEAVSKMQLKPLSNVMVRVQLNPLQNFLEKLGIRK